MAFPGSKKSVKGNIAAFRSIADADQVANKNIANSDRELRQNSGSPFGFLISILLILAGSEIIKVILGRIIANTLRKIEANVKQTLKNRLDDELPEEGSDSITPSTPTQLNIPLERMDFGGGLKQSFETGEPTACDTILEFPEGANSPNKQLYDTVANGNGVVAGFNANVNDQNILVLNIDTEGKNIKSFLLQNGGLIDKVRIIQPREIIVTIFELLLGRIRKKNNSRNNFNQTQELIKAIEKATREEADNPVDITDFNSQDLSEIEEATANIDGLYTLDLVCGSFTLQPNSDAICDILSNDITSPQGTIPSENELNNAFNNAYEQQANSLGIPNNEKNAGKIGFFKRLSEIVTQAIGVSIFNNADFKVLLNLVNQVKAGELPPINNPLDLINENQGLIKCTMQAASATLAEELFNIVKREVLEITRATLTRIARERIQNYVKVLRSIVRL